MTDGTAHTIDEADLRWLRQRALAAWHEDTGGRWATDTTDTEGEGRSEPNFYDLSDYVERRQWGMARAASRSKPGLYDLSDYVECGLWALARAARTYRPASTWSTWRGVIWQGVLGDFRRQAGRTAGRYRGYTHQPLRVVDLSEVVASWRHWPVSLEDRVAIARYLARLDLRDQRICWWWANGETCVDIAARLGVTPGRVTQRLTAVLPHYRQYKAHYCALGHAKRRGQCRACMKTCQRSWREGRSSASRVRQGPARP